MLNKLIVGSSPHIRNNMKTQIIFADFLIGLSPILIMALVVYKEVFLVLLLCTVLIAIFTDKICTKIFKLPVEEYAISSIISAVLLMLTLPINTPLWVLFFGIVFSLLIGKFIFGGLGQNLFNPALLGRVFLMVSFPQYVYSYKNIDGTVGATILYLLKQKAEVFEVLPDVKTLIFKINDYNSIGEISLLALLLGYFYLTIRKRIDGKMSFLMMLTVFMGALLLGKNGFQYLFSGGVVFGAIYFLTDPISSPHTKGAKIAYAIFVGVLVVLIREFTAYPEGVAYAILFGNMFSPLFNKFFKPRVFGRKRDMKEFFNLLKILIFTIISVFLLNVVDKVYLKKMEVKKEQVLIKEMKELIPLGNKFDLYENSEYYNGFLFIPVYNEKETKIAYIVKGKSRGYSEKEIEFLLAIDLKGKTMGHKIISHQETLGLGSKIAEKEFEKLWVNKDINSKFDKKIDSFSGATYTFLNFFKTIKEILKIYDEKIINPKNSSQKESSIYIKKDENKTSKEKIESVEIIEDIKIVEEIKPEIKNDVKEVIKEEQKNEEIPVVSVTNNQNQKGGN